MTISERWAGGVPLFQALSEFGDPVTVAEWEATLGRHPLVSMMSAVAEQLQIGETLGEKFQHAHEDFNRVFRLRSELAAQVLRRVSAGELSAVGYVLPRNPNDGPAPVPQDVLGGKVDWENSTLTGNGLTYVAVRICRADSYPQGGVSRGPGRPSRRDQIIAAFEALDAEGRIDRNSSLASHFGAVRQRLNIIFPDQGDNEKGLGEKALYSVLSPLFGRSD